MSERTELIISILFIWVICLSIYSVILRLKIKAILDASELGARMFLVHDSMIENLRKQINSSQIQTKE